MFQTHFHINRFFYFKNKLTFLNEISNENQSSRLKTLAPPCMRKIFGFSAWFIYLQNIYQYTLKTNTEKRSLVLLFLISSFIMHKDFS